MNDSQTSNEIDSLGRTEFAVGLTRIVKSFSGEAVIVLDGEWGIGKSHFIKAWRNTGNCRTVYFDAFAADYHANPFIPLCATLYEELGFAEKSARDLLEKSRTVGVALLKSILRVGLKAATCGVVDTNDPAIAAMATGFRDDAVQISTDAIAAYIDQSIQDFAKERESFEAFKSTLKAIAAETANEKQPLVFIVDELDRCRPSFAVELLEQIKHLFSVPGVVFLLVLNQEQLASAVKVQYGCNDDSSWKYLRKFVDLTISLPHVELVGTETAKSVQFLDTTIQSVFGSLECERVFHETLRTLCSLGGAPARDIQQLARLSLVIHITNSWFLKMEDTSRILACLSFLSVASPFLFEELQRSRARGAGADELKLAIRKRLGLVRNPLSPREEDRRAVVSQDFHVFMESISHSGEYKRRVDNQQFNPEELLKVVKNVLP